MSPSPLNPMFEVPLGYELVKSKDSNLDPEEISGLCVAGFTALVAVALIFLTVRGIDRPTTFAAGLSLLGGAGVVAKQAIKK